VKIEVAQEVLEVFQDFKKNHKFFVGIFQEIMDFKEF
jgi:hypothetical protein